MRPLVPLGFAAIAVVAAATEPEPSQQIEISADVPTVEISPRRAGRVAVRLPSLTYSLALTLSCAADWQPASVSVSIADSRKVLSGEELDDADVLELKISVPSSQIAPLRVERFCTDSDQQMGDRGRITIPAALSAQASIRCAAGSEQKISYVSKPLDVTLECSGR